MVHGPLSVSPLSPSVSTPFQKSPTFPRRRAASKVSSIETAGPTTMAFATSLLPVPASRVCASPAPELAAFSPAKKSVSFAAARRRRGPSHGVRAEVNESASALAVDALSQVKHVLLPVLDRNPYLSEGTRQAAATTASLAKKYGADITVVVIDDKPKESVPEHDTQMSSIRWHLSEGGFSDFRLMERLGEGLKPTAIIGEVADEWNLDLVVLSMEAIHSKHVDGNLLAEFIPCPVLLLPL